MALQVVIQRQSAAHADTEGPGVRCLKGLRAQDMAELPALTRSSPLYRHRRAFAASIQTRSTRLARWRALPVFAWTLLSFALAWFPTRADQPAASPSDRLESIVVTGKKLSIPDAEVTRRVETALQNNSTIFDDHITVETRNGVVWLHGLIFDEWSLERAYRAARKASGGKRIVLDLEMISDSDASN
jgi:BON domain